MSEIEPEQLMRFLFQLRARGVTDRRVLEAMERIDRRLFVRPTFADHALDDVPLPIACGQTISQPSIVARMTEALRLTDRHKVLEIGTGSGYQAAVLALLARRVYTVERHLALVRAARQLFERLDLANVTVIHGDGTEGLPLQAPFDRIILTAAAEDPPQVLIDQLKPGGIMVLPVGRSDRMQMLIAVHKREDGSLDYSELGAVRFVPLVEGLAEDG